MPLVQNTITESIPGSGTVRLAMDFGNLSEILAGDLVESVSISIAARLPGAPNLTVVADTTLITGGYLASALFTGGKINTYYVTWTPTLVSGQVLPPRTGTLILQ